MAITITAKTYTCQVDGDGFMRTRPPLDTTAPTLTSGITFSNVSVGQATLAWSPAADSQSGVRNYDVEYTPAGGSATVVVVTGTTLTLTSLPSGTLSARYRARDNAATPNVSAYSQSFTVTIPNPVAAGQLRWSPGHYVRNGIGPSASSWQTVINQLNSSMKGIFHAGYWGRLETSQGVYDWSDWDAIYDAAAAANKKVIFRLQTINFGDTDPFARAAPAYLGNGLTYFRRSPSIACGVRLWEPAAMAHYIRVQKAIIDRYKNRSTSRPNTLVQLQGVETVIGQSFLVPPDPGTGGTAVSGYSVSNFVTQLIRAIQEVRAYAPEISWGQPLSWLNGDDSQKTQMQRLFAAARADKGVFVSGGPDMLVNGTGSRGTSDGFEVMYGNIGGIDHRGVYPITGETQRDDILSFGATLDTVYAKAVTQNKSSHMVWNYNYGAAAITFADVLNYIPTHPVYAPLPTALVGLVNPV